MTKKFNIKKNISTLFLFLMLTSCASPKVVNIIGPNDNSMSCEELSSEISKANKYFDEAQKQKKTNTPHNIGAILFFYPGWGVTRHNVEEASKAATARAEHLNKLKEKKNCI